MKSNKLSSSFFIGTGIFIGIVLVSIISFFWLPFPPEMTDMSLRLSRPDIKHWVGTDKLGRDIFTQLLLGSRYAVLVALSAPAIAALIGIPLGLLAANSKKIIDDELSYLFDALIAFPSLLLAMLIVTVRGASLSSAIIAIGISTAAPIARITRIQALQVLSQDFVRAAYTCGTSVFKIQIVHVLPNIIPVLVVQLVQTASSAILTESSLAFLGLSSPPPTASWGRLLMEAQSSVLLAPWGAVVPGCAIILMVLSLHFLGEGLRKVYDPQDEVSV